MSAIDGLLEANESYAARFDKGGLPLPPAKRLSKITTISVAPLIGEAIKRIHRGESVGALFSSEVSFTQEMLLWEDGVAKTLDARGDRPGSIDDELEIELESGPMLTPVLPSAGEGDR